MAVVLARPSTWKFSLPSSPLSRRSSSSSTSSARRASRAEVPATACSGDRQTAPTPPPQTQATRDLARSFKPGRWLTDASIAAVYADLTSFEEANGLHLGGYTGFGRRERGALPKGVLLMDPAVAHWLLMSSSIVSAGAAEEREEALISLGFDEKQLVLCPISDSRSGLADGGRHWSLLMCIAKSRSSKSRPGRWEFIHFDSMQADGSRSHRQACRLARHLARTADVTVRVGRCALQNNCTDCSIYVLVNTEIIVDAFISHHADQEREAWATAEKRLSRVTPAEVAAYRAECYRTALQKACMSEVVASSEKLRL